MGPSSFLVEVNPSSFQQNQPIDITITAMKNGQPDTSYTGDVRLGVEGLRPSEYTVPSKGRYNFTVGDLGKKTFSKGLEIKKPGTYTITASNVENTLQGKTQVTVMNIGTTAEVKTIEILSPLANGKETQSNILLLAQAPDLPNSLAQVYLNGAFVEEISIDQFGTINGALTKLKD
ncbi:MAG: hypothetical protein LBP53_06980 [Candidatus Peribacteria bacterium]|nr:hypothetical protein [Candidatus Peribacteria bacterium]